MEHYSHEQRTLITSIKPGMTDYSSLEFRDEAALLAGADDPITEYRERIVPVKCMLSARYIEGMSTATDVALILRTLAALFLAKRQKTTSHSLPRLYQICAGKAVHRLGRRNNDERVGLTYSTEA